MHYVSRVYIYNYIYCIYMYVRTYVPTYITLHYITRHYIPYYSIPLHTIPYCTITVHTIPYHTIAYHSIPYHTLHTHTYAEVLGFSQPCISTLTLVDAATSSARGASARKPPTSSVSPVYSSWADRWGLVLSHINPQMTLPKNEDLSHKTISGWWF